MPNANKMNVDPMRVVLKREEKNIKSIRTTMIFAIPIHMVDQVKKDLDKDIRLGILEKVEGQDNHSDGYSSKKIWQMPKDDVFFIK